MEIGEILNEIKNDPIYVESIGNGIDVEKTILEHMDKWKKYKSLNTVVTFAKSELTKKIQSKNDVAISGVSVGQSDVFGQSIPVTFPLLLPDGKHVGLVHYDVNKIPEPSRVELKVRHNPKYNNYHITEIVKLDPLDKKSIIARLLRVAKGPDEISLEHLQKRQVLVVRGVINWVNPSKRFDKVETGENSEVYLPTEDSQQRFVPVLNINLNKGGGNNTVVFQFARQRYGKPIYDIADIDAICHNAVTDTPDPVEQAKIVKAGLTGRTVVGVGEVSGMKIGDKGNFINLKTFAIYEYGPSSLPESQSGGQTKLVEDEKPIVRKEQSTSTIATPAQPVEQPIQKVSQAAPSQNTPVQQTTTPTTSFKTSKMVRANLIKEYGEKIRGIADVLGRGAGSFSPADLRAPLKVPDEIPDAILDEAISYAVLPPREDE
jgi:hypothetical protein